MTTVHVIRHGAAETSGAGEPALLPVGVRQAERTGVYLKSRGVSQIYSSPMIRARQTAAILGGKLDIAPTVDRRLGERDDGPSKWESTSEAGKRLIAFLSETQLRYPKDVIAAVTHGRLIVDFLHDCLAHDELVRLHNDFGTHYDPGIANCSITVVHVTCTGIDVKEFALTDHLD